MKPLTMIMTLATTLVLTLPAAPASAAATSAALPNSPTYCLVFPFLPQCRYLLG